VADRLASYKIQAAIGGVLPSEVQMRKRITRISPLQAAKVLGIFHFFTGIVFAVFLRLRPAVLDYGYGRHWGFQGQLIWVPVIWGCAAFVSGLVGGWLYNVVASWVGGFEVTLTDLPAAPPSSAT
jgi:hypothetical protein